MESISTNSLHLGDATKQIAHRVCIIFENRVQLLMVEVQEEGQRALLAIGLALGAAVFGLLAGMALTFLVAVAFWEHSPVIALLVLVAVYISAAAIFFWRLIRLQRDWQILPGTLDQLEKDRECLKKTFI